MRSLEWLRLSLAFLDQLITGTNGWWPSLTKVAEAAEADILKEPICNRRPNAFKKGPQKRGRGFYKRARYSESTNKGPKSSRSANTSAKRPVRKSRGQKFDWTVDNEKGDPFFQFFGNLTFKL